MMSARIARAFEAAVAADTYAVLHLHREVDGVWAHRSIYVDEAVRFMARLARRCRGNTQFRRLDHLSRFLPNAITIEKLADGPHLNVLIQKPSRWTFEDFQQVFLEEWWRSQWASTDERAVYIAPREAGSDLFGYTHKEGDESLVRETLRFSAC